MKQLIKAKYDGKVIECYPLGYFSRMTREEISVHAVLGVFSKQKIEKKLLKEKTMLVFIPWKNQLKKLALIPFDDVIDSFDDFKNEWVKVQSFVSDYELQPNYKLDVHVEDFMGEEFIYGLYNFMASVYYQEDDICLRLLYKKKPELLQYEF